MTDSLIKYFRLLYDRLPFPIQVINEEGKITYVNEEFTSQWGYNLSELNEYTIYNDSELKKNGVLNLILKTFTRKNSGFINNYDDSLLKSKGVTVPIFRTKIFFTSLDNKGFVVLLHEDQTELILAEAEAKKARDGNKEVERLKDSFLTVLSHELRTPLNIVLGYASIIKESMKEKLSPEDKIYLDNLYNGSERLYNTITQMLEFAQIEAGNFVLNTETVDVTSILRNCIDINSKSAADKKIEIKTKFIEDHIHVNVDIQSLENAINNVLNNAIKFTRHGFVEIETDILNDKDLAVIRIKDSGVGISPQYLDHLFRPFSQEESNIGRNYEGNGLGLALSKRYIEKMGGSLLVDSIKGVGSTFTFTLPLSSDRKNDKSGSITGTNNKLSKLLLIDDKSESSALLNAFVKNFYSLEICNLKGFQIEVLNKIEPEIIIIDVNQSNWNDTLKLCVDIKNNDSRKRPVVIISSEYLDAKIKEFYSAGADKFLVKPFSKGDIIKTIQGYAV